MLQQPARCEPLSTVLSTLLNADPIAWISDTVFFAVSDDSGMVRADLSTNQRTDLLERWNIDHLVYHRPTQRLLLAAQLSEPGGDIRELEFYWFDLHTQNVTALGITTLPWQEPFFLSVSPDGRFIHYVCTIIDADDQVPEGVIIDRNAPDEVLSLTLDWTRSWLDNSRTLISIDPYSRRGQSVVILDVQTNAVRRIPIVSRPGSPYVDLRVLGP